MDRDTAATRAAAFLKLTEHVTVSTSPHSQLLDQCAKGIAVPRCTPPSFDVLGGASAGRGVVRRALRRTLQLDAFVRCLRHTVADACLPAARLHG